MDNKQQTDRPSSRREFLKRAPLAVAGALIVGMILKTPVLSRLGRGRQAPVFPEGSIFTPAKDPRSRT